MPGEVPLLELYRKNSDRLTPKVAAVMAALLREPGWAVPVGAGQEVGTTLPIEGIAGICAVHSRTHVRK